jgi:hypothetical protein
MTLLVSPEPFVFTNCGRVRAFWGTSMKRLVFGMAVALLAAGTDRAFAAGGCALNQLASFDIISLPSGNIAVAIKLAGSEQKMRLALNVANSGILAAFADRSQLQTKSLSPAFAGPIRYFDQNITQEVLLPDVQLGLAHGSNVWVLRIPEKLDDDVIGVMGSGLLSNMDVELDLAHSKLNLFSADYCTGNVVYWAKSFTVLPFERDPIGHIVFRMNLDGKPVTASLKTAAGPASIDLSVVAHLFDLNEHSAGMRVVSSTSDDRKGFKFPFKALALEGVTITNPDITIIPDDPADRCNSQYHSVAGKPGARCFSGGDLTIGLSELRAMHLYFAMKEKKLYVTSAVGEPRLLGEKTPDLMPDQPISLRCSGPPRDRLFAADGPSGYVTAQAIFSINSANEPGAVPVTRAADGVCTVAANDRTIIATASFSPRDAADALKHVDVQQSTDKTAGGRSYTFTVKAKDDWTGKLTLAFPVVYRAAAP